MMRNVNKLLVGLLLLPSGAGCLNTQSVKNSMMPESPIGGSAVATDAKLSDREAAEIQFSVAEELDKNGFMHDAAERYEKARQLDSKYKHVCRKLAVLYDKMGNDRRALEEYDDAIKLAPKDPDLMNDLGYCHYNRGRWTDAETCFRHAIAINPKHKRATINLGLALAQQNRFDEATEAFMKVTRAAEAKANLAFVLAAQGKKAESKSMYQEALKLEPGLAIAQNGLASLEAPKKATVPDSPIRAARCDATCADGVGCTAKTPLPDMSPITIDPRASKLNAAEAPPVVADAP